MHCVEVEVEAEAITSSLSGKLGEYPVCGVDIPVPAKRMCFSHKRWYQYDYKSPWRKLGTAKCIPGMARMWVLCAILGHARRWSPSLGFAQGCLSSIKTLTGLQDWKVVARIGNSSRRILVRPCPTASSHKALPSPRGRLHSPTPCGCRVVRVHTLTVAVRFGRSHPVLRVSSPTLFIDSRHGSINTDCTFPCMRLGSCAAHHVDRIVTSARLNSSVCLIS
ncbi:hypothetical protein VFPFJ_11776 [Purpureocillium lilacinum]|uniref:Uncharacterized protein n=1 Tax=Purpureocillium lilacinum TaxID=33203 RepID=A0A179EVJ6_PURLI|nr:hypothetical protein VFPFJ_11776 [Purpureocillium lilacinum]OAQ57227.1 hypothetical protein VFPFJ_11776 [Purpureocillium lilacinum]